MKHLIILGTGAFARELYWLAQESIGFGTEWDIKGYLDGAVPMDETEYKKLPLPVLGIYDSYEIKKDDVFTCGVGSPNIRKDFIEKIEKKNGVFINIIHKTANIHGNVKLGKGIIICPFVFVQNYATIDDYVLLNNTSGVGHDVHIGKYSCLMAYVELCGFVEVGQEVYFGSGARVLPKGKIGNNVFVGAGSVVLKGVKTGKKVFGNPARVIDV